MQKLTACEVFERRQYTYFTVELVRLPEIIIHIASIFILSYDCRSRTFLEKKFLSEFVGLLRSIDRSIDMFGGGFLGL